MQGLVATFITDAGVRVHSSVFVLTNRSVAVCVGNVVHVVDFRRVLFRSRVLEG